MEKSTPLTITISRQKGCGGAYLGQRIAKALGITYLDRELLTEIANKLDTTVEVVEAYDERPISVWEALVEPLSMSIPWTYTPPPIQSPAIQVSELEAEIIVTTAAEKSVVVVGRGGSYLLRDHPKLVTIMLHASLPWRCLRTQDIYSLSHQEALKVIEKTDTERARYKKSMSGLETTDATQYHLALDTGVLGLENAATLILHYIRTRFPDDTVPAVGNDRSLD